MTIQQEAYKLIDEMPEDCVRIIIQLMQKMGSGNGKERKALRIEDYVTPTERAMDADKYVRELRENDRVWKSV